MQVAVEYGVNRVPDGALSEQAARHFEEYTEAQSRFDPQAAFSSGHSFLNTIAKEGHLSDPSLVA
ncbi:hypothetical protein GF389_06345 [Candidatus Dojkabacteria bacterium]|nr:hypothetical protein [Candidatus Dojkabacteria bacterium]